MYDAVNEVVEMPIEVDELFEEAVRICVDMKRASTSVLQRRLKIVMEEPRKSWIAWSVKA